MTEQKQPPLPDDWEDRDSIASFFEYIALCREEQAAGKPLAAMFKPREADES